MDINKFRDIAREQFPLTETIAYLDTSTTGLLSKNATQAMVDHLTDRFEDAMDVTKLKENWKLADCLRPQVAELLGASQDEIIFSDSCSSMLNIFSSGISLNDNANVVVSGLTFPSTAYTWMNRVGEENLRFATPVDGQVPLDSLFSLVDEDTAVISLCLVENTTGFRHDLKTISAFCQEKGIHLVVDATQAAGAIHIDVEATPVDFLTTSCFKWLGCPFGLAFAYCSKRIMDKIHPTYVGWTGNKRRMDHSKYNLNLSDGASRFETGSLNWLALKGLKEAIELYLTLGKEDVEAYILSLTDYLYEQVDELENVKVLGKFAEVNRSGISYLLFPEEWELSNDILKDNGIQASVGSLGRMRIALHYYNKKEDVDQLISFLRSYQK